MTADDYFAIQNLLSGEKSQENRRELSNEHRAINNVLRSGCGPAMQR
jgi:hypothetical protein